MCIRYREPGRVSSPTFPMDSGLYSLSHLAGPRWGFIKIFNIGLSMRVEKETHRQTHTEHGVWSLRSLKRTLSGYRLIMGASRVAARCICKWWIYSLWSHMSIIWLLLSKTSLPDNSKTMFICNICICNSWIRQNLLIVFWVVSCFEKGSHFVALAGLELGDICLPLPCVFW